HGAGGAGEEPVGGRVGFSRGVALLVGVGEEQGDGVVGGELLAVGEGDGAGAAQQPGQGDGVGGDDAVHLHAELLRVHLAVEPGGGGEVGAEVDVLGPDGGGVGVEVALLVGE